MWETAWLQNVRQEHESLRGGSQNQVERQFPEQDSLNLESEVNVLVFDNQEAMDTLEDDENTDLEVG